MSLWDAAQTGDFEEVRLQLETDPSLINATSPQGWTALHLAAHFGHANAAAYLLALGADPLTRSTNTMENLAIHAAAAGRHAGIIALLLGAGTPVDATQQGGYTALHAAAQHGDLASIEVLLAHGADRSLAAGSGETAIDFARNSQHETAIARLSR